MYLLWIIFEPDDAAATPGLGRVVTPKNSCPENKQTFEDFKTNIRFLAGFSKQSSIQPGQMDQSEIANLGLAFTSK